MRSRRKRTLLRVLKAAAIGFVSLVALWFVIAVLLVAFLFMILGAGD